MKKEFILCDAMKILIIDDEVDICNFLNYSLKKRNFESSFAHTIADGEQLLESYNPSILLLDNHLPDGFGLDYIQKFRQRYPQLKIIMISAYDTPGDRDHALRAGADYFISKPFNIKELNTIIDKVA
ncbi:MAG TPA: response regulator [Chitinophagaceae bacterium]|nr:response regulator [Chitinophagaceae bacterium]